MLPVNWRFIWGHLWAWRQWWQLASSHVSRAWFSSCSSLRSVCRLLSNLSFGWLGRVQVLSLFYHILRLKDETFAAMALWSYSPAQPILLTSSGLVGLEGRRNRYRSLEKILPPSWRTMLCDQDYAPHFPPFRFPLMCTHDRHMNVSRVEWWCLCYSIRIAVGRTAHSFEQLAVIMTLGRLLLELFIVI